MAARAGTIFILSNDAMPGFSRVEFAIKGDIANKIKQINSAALPVPFRLFFAAKVNDLKLVRRNLFYLFAEQRDGNDGTYFTVNPDELRAAIELAAIETVELTDEEQGITDAARAKMDLLRTRHEDVHFKAQLPQAGTLMCFTKDNSMTCQSIGNGMVVFDGAELTPSAAAARALRKLGFDWGDAHGAGYWLALGTTPQAHAKSKAQDRNNVAETMPEVPVVLEDADDSPIMFIRNKRS